MTDDSGGGLGEPEHAAKPRMAAARTAAKRPLWVSISTTIHIRGRGVRRQTRWPESVGARVV